MKVKKLEWEECGYRTLSADTALGEYRITRYSDGDRYVTLNGRVIHYSSGSEQETMDEAQSHFELIVKACLEDFASTPEISVMSDQQLGEAYNGAME